MCSLHAFLKPLSPDCLGRCWSHHDLKGSRESTQRALDDQCAQTLQADSNRAPFLPTSFNFYVARGDKPHQLAAPLGVPFRLGTTSDAPHWLPGHLLLNARPLVWCARYIDATVASEVCLEWFRHVGRGPSRAHCSHRVTWYGYTNDPYEYCYG